MRRPLCLCCLIFVILIIGITKMFPYEYNFSQIPSEEIVLIQGKVSKKEIQNKNGQITYIICLEQIKSLSDSLADDFGDKQSKYKQLNDAEGIMCYIKDSYVPNIGSTVQIKGRLAVFDTPDNPGEFHVALYYKIKGIDLKMYDCQLVAYSQTYSVVEENLFRMKSKLLNLLKNCFREEYVGIAEAILFAENGDIPEETKSLYRENGMLHILCVSGLHISILGMGLFKVLNKMRIPDILNAVFCILMMVLYGIMIGMGTSVFRAILMFSMNIIARLLHRTYDLLTAACVGAFLILLEQPLYMYHSGFLLSFLSVVSLGAFRPFFPKKVCKIKFINDRADSFFSTLSVWIFTLPVYGRYYYEVSLSGLLLNVLILPFVSIVLVLVIVVCGLGSMFLPMGQCVARLCELFLWAFEGLFKIFDSIGSTTLILGYVGLFKCFLFYGGIILLLCMAEKVKRRYLYLGIVALCTIIVFKLPKPLTITCLSVGQGDSAVIEYKDLVCVIDAGSSTESKVANYTVLPFLKYRGIREIDYLFLSHADSDHINAVGEILKQSRSGIRVRKIVVSDGGYLEEYGKIPALAKEYKIPIYEMNQNDCITSGEVSLQCLAPSRQFVRQTGESNNASSMVLLLKMDGFQMLFAGDVEEEGEEMLNKVLKAGQVTDIDVLKVAHHGSKNSTSEVFLQITKPRVGIISCGENNRYGHPHNETLLRLKNAGCKIFVTKDCGAVSFQVIGETFKVTKYNN